MGTTHEYGSASLGLLGGRVSLRSRVKDALRESMIAGDMEPGKVYSAPTLAEMLGVSATPVREAMIDLEREGLVTPLRNKGYRVVAISDKDLDDLTELRALIEVPTVAKIARMAEPERIETLRPLAEELNRTAEAGALREFVRADMEFHLELLAIAGNLQIIEDARRLRSMSRLSGLAELAESGRLSATAREHGELLDLLLVRDVAGAEELMQRHIGHVRGVWAGFSED